MNDDNKQRRTRRRQAQKSVLNQIIKLSKCIEINEMNEGENIIDEGSNKNNNAVK